MRPNDFRKFLREYYDRSLIEANQIKLENSVDQGETSLDNQVDRLLISYEKDSKSVKQESRDFRSLARKFLKEAGEEADSKEGVEEKDSVPGEGSSKLSSDNIDINTFAEHVVRLVDNYDSLLDVRDTLVRRAETYLNKNYEPQVLSDFKSVMRDRFDVEVGVTDVEKQDEFLRPTADRAGKGTE